MAEKRFSIDPQQFAGHSPGPWETDGHRVVCDGLNEFGCVARLYHVPRHRSAERLDADLALITAAPAMLRVLRVLQHALSTDYDWSADTLDNIAGILKEFGFPVIDNDAECPRCGGDVWTHGVTLNYDDPADWFVCPDQEVTE